MRVVSELFDPPTETCIIGLGIFLFRWSYDKASNRIYKTLCQHIFVIYLFSRVSGMIVDMCLVVWQDLHSNS